MTVTVSFEEIRQLFKETDERFKATELRFKDTDEQFKATKELIKANAEAARRRLSRQLGHFSNQVGEFAEELVVPAAKRLFAARGIPVHTVARNVQGERNGRTTKVDILVINTDHVVAIEVKTRPRINHVDEHLDRLAILKEMFPEYGGRKLLGAIAGMIFDENVARYAYQRGLFVLGQSGDAVTILNDGKFQPKVW